MTFNHPSRTRAFWRRWVRASLAKAPTPFYLFSAAPIAAALAELRRLGPSARSPEPGRERPVQNAPRLRHWLSCKTQPIKPLLRWWRQQGRGIEVVSEFELQAALAEGFTPRSVLVNGPAKQVWLPRHPVKGLWVNFDSTTELQALLPMAKALDWGVGIRCHTHQEFDPGAPNDPTQFGLTPLEASRAVQDLMRAGVRLTTVHFHLRTNVASPAVYERAIREVAVLCRRAGVRPKYLDCGGGLPPRHVLGKDGQAVDRRFRLSDLAQVYTRAAREFPGLEEIWLENGRFVSARAGALVVRVLDVKERRGLRQLICDGGRTTQALISCWEDHELLPLPPRSGRRRLTVVCGPTCMAFDQLARRYLPASIAVGDHLIWLEAGAYHIPWETRFSHGYAAVLWQENGRIVTARRREPFTSWWGQWS